MSNLDNFITYLIYTASLIAIFIISLENVSNPWITAILSVILVASILLKDILELHQHKFYKATIWIEIFIASAIGVLSNGNSYVIFFFILIYYSIIYQSRLVSFFTITTMFIIYLSLNCLKYYKSNNIALIKFSINEFFIFITVLVVSILVKNILNKNKLLDFSRKELYIKHQELNYLYDSLKSAYVKLEELTIAKERNNIAREIHDTVGHTLTTALVELEAGNILFNENSKEAEAKFKSATEQVRNGLVELRTSVRALKDVRPINYYEDIQKLINNTTKHADITIRTDINRWEILNQAQQSLAYRLLQEGVTNGIKHGNASAFLFKINVEGTLICLSLEDNGCGTTVINKGFGLRAMEERVQELKGSIKIETSIEDGFNIYIFIPINYEVYL